MGQAANSLVQAAYSVKVLQWPGPLPGHLEDVASWAVGPADAQHAGVAATGANLRVTYCVCYDVADGAITALRAYLPISLMVALVRAAADRVAS
jgi:hypothetical protein